MGRNLLPDEAFDLVAQIGCLFDTRAGSSAHVQLELSGVDLGEEVTAEPRYQENERADANRGKTHQE